MIQIICKLRDSLVERYCNFLNKYRIKYEIILLDKIMDGNQKYLIDIPVVVSIDRKTIELISLKLHKHDIHIYDVLIKENLVINCSQDALNNRSSHLYYRVKNKALCSYLEVQIADHCNLKCRGCMHFSNIVDNPVYFPIQSFESDLMILSKKLDVLKFRIMGGEPFLNPDFEQYAMLIRKYYPNSKIIFVTNGLLLNQISLKKLQFLVSCYCSIDISIYPVIKDKLLDIIKILDSIGLEYHLSGDYKLFEAQFSKFLSSTDTNNKRNSKKCSCNFWSEHKISRCCFPSTIHYFNQCFENKFSVESGDFFQIQDGMNMYSLLDFLQQDIPFCKYCSSNELIFDWEAGINREKASMHDYILK